MKNLNKVDSSDIMSLRLLQFKSYLKILSIPYFIKKTNLPIISDIVENIIKSIYIFNNIVLASCSYIIKTSLKSDIVVIWIDIWDSQNGLNAKMLINRCFNISSYITTIKATSINSGIFQYKNYWKYEHTTFTCYIHSTKYPKCNRLYKLENHRNIA